jgi:hypothetical protein
VAVGLVLVGFSAAATDLGFTYFAAEVRPWVTELALVAVFVLAAAALVFAGYRVPAPGGRWPRYSLGVALAGGAAWGAWDPQPWVGDVVGLGWPLLALPTLAIVVGWLAALAADAGRGLLGSALGGRLLVAGALVALAGVERGALAGVVIAVAAAAVSSRGTATAVAVAVTWGWLGGSAVAVCRWSPAVWQVGLFLLAGIAAGVAQAVFQQASATGWPAAAVETEARPEEIEATIPR